MLTKIKKMFVLVMLAVFVFALTGCGGGIKGGLKAIVLEAEVTEGFVLPSVEVEGAVTTWTSNNDAIVIDEDYADVVRPSLTDVEVTLTATVTLGEKTETRDFLVVVKCLLAPDAINIKVSGLTAVEGESDTYYLTKDDTTQLVVEVEDEEMSSEVTWTAKNKRVTVENGLVTGVSYGEVEVVATSVYAGEGGAKITDSVKFIVVEHINPMQVLLINKNKIEASIPEFIDGLYTFPMAENESVETLYFDALADRTDPEQSLYFGEYEYVEGVDRQETIYCVLTYMGQQVEFEFIINVVTNKEDNEFLALNYAEEQLDEIFGAYVSKDGVLGDKISEDIEVPVAFTADEAMYDVEIKYDTVTDYNPNPLKVVSVTNDDGTVSKVAQYTKPNDDANVRVEIYLRTANVDRVVRYNVTTCGYTKEEIVDYLSENVLPQPDETGVITLVCSHITLPTSDLTRKFGDLTIEWTSSNEEVLTSGGVFANPALETATNVTLTATIKYKGTVSSMFAFEETTTMEVEVKPAENQSQIIALQVSNYVNAPEFMEKIAYFPFGLPGREGGNVMPLPRKVSELTSEMAEYADLDITWTANEEGLLDENFKLKKQYLRYHEVVLTYAITYEGNTATNEVVINVGIAENKNTVYIGGWFAQDQSGGGVHAGDALGQLSKFDAPAGVVTERGRTYGGTYGYAVFGGYTYSIKVTEEDGSENTYMFFVQLGTIVEIDNTFAIDEATGTNPVLNDFTKKYFSGGNNWAAFFVNKTDKEVKIPMSPGGG